MGLQATTVDPRWQPFADRVQHLKENIGICFRQTWILLNIETTTMNLGIENCQSQCISKQQNYDWIRLNTFILAHVPWCEARLFRGWKCSQAKWDMPLLTDLQAVRKCSSSHIALSASVVGGNCIEWSWRRNSECRGCRNRTPERQEKQKSKETITYESDRKQAIDHSQSWTNYRTVHKGYTITQLKPFSHLTNAHCNWES